MLTINDLNAMKAGEVFASGKIENSPNGLHMTDEFPERELLWIAKRGSVGDWAIYTHWSSYDAAYVEKYGQKVITKEHIQKLVPCDKEAFKAYRM